MGFIIICCNGSESTVLVKKCTWRTFSYGWASDPAYCTLSIGIACATKEMPDAAEWLKAADDALYNAKRAGKNRIFAS